MCRICLHGDDDPADPIQLRCKCSTGNYHDSCFISWARRRPVMSCEICRGTFIGARVVIASAKVHSCYGTASCYICFCASINVLCWIIYLTLAHSIMCVESSSEMASPEMRASCYEGFLLARLLLLSMNAVVMGTLIFICGGIMLCPQDVGVVTTNITKRIVLDGSLVPQGEIVGADILSDGESKTESEYESETDSGEGEGEGSSDEEEGHSETQHHHVWRPPTEHELIPVDPPRPPRGNVRAFQ
jgi:hypothetical protein